MEVFMRQTHRCDIIEYVSAPSSTYDAKVEIRRLNNIRAHVRVYLAVRGNKLSMILNTYANFSNMEDFQDELSREILGSEGVNMVFK